MSKAGHYIARSLYPAIECEHCGKKAAECRLERHHKDGNHMNNIASNVCVLCVRCHMVEDGRLAKSTERLRVHGRRAKPIYKGTECVVAICNREAKYKGLCNSHYYRARLNGGNPGTSAVRDYRRSK